MLELLVFILGLCIGSFLNVCIYRLPRNESIVSIPSHCIRCERRLNAIDIIPVISYLILRGKCRFCGATFSRRYAMVELLTALLFSWCFLIIGLVPQLLIAFIFTAFLIVITLIDYDYQLIFDKVLVWFAGIGIFTNILIDNIKLFGIHLTDLPIFIVRDTGIIEMVIGALAGGGLLLVIAIISRGGMGGGDIKFAAVIGLWLGWKFTLLGLIFSFIFGGLIGILLLLFKIKGRKDFIPFGPFIAGGSFLVMLYGAEIFKWYLSLL